MRPINLDEERNFENIRVEALNSQNDPRFRQGKYYWATRLPAREHKLKTLEKISGTKVLEIGCSSGEDAKKYTDKTAFYTGVDISDEAIKKASELGLKNTEFICTDGHRLPFVDGEFDFVIVNALLHHLDLEIALAEINRVLKFGGGLIFHEPLGINPLFQMYRLITPGARTKDECPFSFSDLKMMKRYFDMKDVQYFGFFSIASAFARFNTLRSLLTEIDGTLAKTPLKYLFWQFCGFAQKKIVCLENTNDK